MFSSYLFFSLLLFSYWLIKLFNWTTSHVVTFPEFSFLPLKMFFHHVFVTNLLFFLLTVLWFNQSTFFWCQFLELHLLFVSCFPSFFIIHPFFLLVYKYLLILFPFLKLSSSMCFFLCFITFSSFLYALIFRINQPIGFFYQFLLFLLLYISPFFLLFFSFPLFLVPYLWQYILVTKQCASCLGSAKALKNLKIHKVTSKSSHLCLGLPRGRFP
jgi:hypothetical protein